ncbi:MAG: arginine deiminase [Lachnospiraceae bacterium]|nr:arginine deiminase [Lachnospiraceae bacterium]
MAAINVKSEIKPLKKVMLHRPGNELLNLTPDTLERLLFDDIPFLRVAKEEHDAFAKVLRDNGVEVVYLEDLCAEVLAESDEIRDKFLYQWIDEAGIKDKGWQKKVYDFMINYAGGDAKKLILKSMEGICLKEIKYNRSEFLVSMMRDDSELLIDPMPNLYFTRDPFATIGNGVSVNKMYSVTRCRETIYGEYIFKYHKDYKDKVDLYYNRYNPYSIEGGDILNLSDKVLAIGISQRTNPAAIELIAKNIFADKNSTIKTILGFDIPKARAFMHLDTVFTQIDVDKFTIHPGILGPLTVYEITPAGEGEIKVTKVESDLEHVLAKHLGVDHVELIKCGGEDRIASEREQWNDGSNTLCIAPGVIVVYQRNEVTNELLRKKGIKVLEIPSAELSRGRGGPRCMSMPLYRED